MAGELDAAVLTVRRKLFDAGTGPEFAGMGATLIPDEFITEELAAAVTTYSNDKPHLVVADIAGNGTPYYAHTVLTSWIDDWSRVESIEYPAGAVGNSYNPTFIALGDDFEPDYRTASVRYFRFPAHTPSASETLRFTYTALHVLSNTANATTIPVPHRDALYDLATSYCCDRLAAKFASSMDSVINTDGTNYRDLALTWRRVGNDFLANYRRKLGLPTSGPAPAMAFGDWDTLASTGQDRLTHWSRRR